MSVTFTVTASSNTEYTIVCECGNTTFPQVYTSYEETYSQLSSITSKCEDPYCNRFFIEDTDSAYDVQMSNMNALTILDVLGIQTEDLFEDRCTGVISAEDLLGRVLVAQALNPADEGTSTYSEGNMVMCGRREGYTESKLADLATLANIALNRNAQIQWA